MNMYEYFEHTADIGIRAFGTNMAEAFEECGKAMFNVMVDVDKVQEKKEIEITAEANDREGLLVEWLNQLLAEASRQEMMLSNFHVQELKKITGGFYVRGIAMGEPLDPEKHEVKIEVKAATYSQLKVEFQRKRVMVQCVVDV